MWQAEVRVDLDAIRENVTRLRAGTTAELMAVVKADGYGHGMVPVARAALDAGATWLGVCTLDEALTLRRAGVAAPVLAWLLVPGLPLHEGIEADVDLGAGSVGLLGELGGGRGARGPAGPRAPQSRHRVVPWRGDSAGLAGSWWRPRRKRRATARSRWWGSGAIWRTPTRPAIPRSIGRCRSSRRRWRSRGGTGSVRVTGTWRIPRPR